MGGESGVQYEYARRMLDFFLNSDFSPATDYIAIIAGRPFMGAAKGFASKEVLSDFDGVFERKDAKPLYVQVNEELGEENGVLNENMGDVWSSLKRLKTPENVPMVEDAVGKIFSYCNLTHEQYVEANRRAAERFIKDSLVKGAKAYITKLSNDMGYLPAIVSGCYKPALDIVCNHLGIPGRHVYATEVGFHGHSVSLGLMIGERKYESRASFLGLKNSILGGGVGTERGCYFLINDNPSALEHPFMKAGLNPALITGNYERHELPFDVSAPCPDAREDLTKLILPMYRFEYGWTAVNTTDARTEQSIINAVLDVVDGMACGPPYDYRSKASIVSKAYKVVSDKDARGLAYKTDAIRDALARFLLMERPESEEYCRAIKDYFDGFVPETHAKRDMLSGLV